MSRRRFHVWLPLLTVVASFATSPAIAQESQQEKSFEKEITITLKMKYLLHLPEGYDKEKRNTR